MLAGYLTSLLIPEELGKVFLSFPSFRPKCVSVCSVCSAGDPEVGVSGLDWRRT